MFTGRTPAVLSPSTATTAPEPPAAPPLEPLEHRAEREPARAKDLGDHFLLPLAQPRPRERDRLRFRHALPGRPPLPSRSPCRPARSVAGTRTRATPPGPPR